MKTAICLAAVCAIAGCVENDSAPLLFGQGVTVGIAVGAPPESGGVPELTVGLRQANIAVVPTVVPKEIEVDSDDRRIASFGKGGVRAETDALSTFGSFSSTNEAKVGSGNVQLGVFFATGVAAQTLADGFRCGMAKTENQPACSFTDGKKAAAPPPDPST